MLESTFRHKFKQSNGVMITENVILFRKPCEIYNIKTDASVQFESLEDAFNYKIGDKTIKQIIDDAPVDIFALQLDGGRGADGGGGTFKFGHADGSGSGSTKGDLPARMNTKVAVNAKSPEAALKAFRDAHANDDYESAVTVDENGYFTQYVHGGATSVSISGKKGEMVYHNHPSGGAFSDMDLISASMGGEKGIVASGKYGDYIFTKSGHFKANNFVKAVKNATIKGKDYNDAVDKWLKKNQSKYGYTYEFRRK